MSSGQLHTEGFLTRQFVCASFIGTVSEKKLAHWRTASTIDRIRDVLPASSSFSPETYIQAVADIPQ